MSRGDEAAGLALQPAEAMPAVRRAKAPASAGKKTMSSYQTASGKPKFVQTLVCEGCSNGWLWPRNLHFYSAPKVPWDPRLRPGDAVVAHMANHAAPIAEDVFRTLDFVARSNRRLVLDFGYDPEKGDVFYDLNEERPGAMFGHIVTLNSWWSHLSGAMLSVAVGVQDFILNFAFAFRLLSDGMCEEDLSPDVVVAFLGAWLAPFVAALVFAAWGASTVWNLHANPKVGNLVTQCRLLDVYKAYFALLVAVYFGLDAHVRDIVVVLHPWKLAQPYAAVKLQGTRAFLLGHYSVGQGLADATEVSRTAVFGIRTFMAITTCAVKVYVAALCGQIVDYALLSLGAFTILQLVCRHILELMQKHRTDKLRSAPAGVSGDAAQLLVDSQASPEGCAKCGQLSLSEQMHEALSQTEIPDVGQRVRLKGGSLDLLGEVDLGPLRDGGVGKVLDIAPLAGGCGTRVLVRVEGAAQSLEHQGTWWYNAAAVVEDDGGPAHGSKLHVVDGSGKGPTPPVVPPDAALVDPLDGDPLSLIKDPRHVNWSENVEHIEHGAPPDFHPSSRSAKGPSQPNDSPPDFEGEVDEVYLASSVDGPRSDGRRPPDEVNARMESLQRQNADLQREMQRMRQNEELIRARVDELIGVAVVATTSENQSGEVARQVEALKIKNQTTENRATRLAKQVAQLTEAMGNLVTKVPPSSPEAMRAGEALVRARLETDYGSHFDAQMDRPSTEPLSGGFAALAPAD